MKYNILEKLGTGAGFFVNEEDLNFVPFSRARAERCWIDSGGKIYVWNWGLGDGINIPERHYWKIAESEKKGELGIDTINRYIKKLEKA